MAILCVCLFGVAHTIVLVQLGFADTGVGALLRERYWGFAPAHSCVSSLVNPIASGANDRRGRNIAVAVVFDQV